MWRIRVLACRTFLKKHLIDFIMFFIVLLISPNIKYFKFIGIWSDNCTHCQAFVSALACGALSMCAMWVVIVLKNVPWAKNKKHRVGMSAGFLVLSIFRFSVLSQWFSFYFSMSYRTICSWGLRGAFLSSRTAVVTGCELCCPHRNPS